MILNLKLRVVANKWGGGGQVYHFQNKTCIHTTRQRSQLSNTFSAWLMTCASRASPNQTTAGLNRPLQPLCSHLKIRRRTQKTRQVIKAIRILKSKVQNEDTSYLGSCSTDMLASSESGSGALRGHLVRHVVSARGQRHTDIICDMHQLVEPRPRTLKCLGSFKARGRKAQHYLYSPYLMVPRTLPWKLLQSIF